MANGALDVGAGLAPIQDMRLLSCCESRKVHLSNWYGFAQSEILDEHDQRRGETTARYMRANIMRYIYMNDQTDDMDIGHEVGYVSFISLEVACLGSSNSTQPVLPPDRSDSQDKHGKSFAMVMRLGETQFSLLLGYSDRNGSRCIRQKVNIHKAVINARILEITKSLLDQFRRKPSNYEIISDRILLFSTRNMRIYQYLQPSITINVFLRLLGMVLTHCLPGTRPIQILSRSFNTYCTIYAPFHTSIHPNPTIVLPFS